ncbi:unnamed protein product [Heligmosomoides polygyrus]|uniref:C2H2-type domain-containing protein n=1 Tax=Heligmosomoides polygyrus TaxID=6339 RepID=A0A183FJC8_HELPZ|nr:unnamed protein product [Heligmosomoides polygyrus]
MQNVRSCEVCGVTFFSQENLSRHRRVVHRILDEVAQNPTGNFRESCPVCHIRIKNVLDLLEHASEFHEFKGKVKHKEFLSFSEFERWKDELEQKHITSWVKRGVTGSEKAFYSYLRCNRSPNTKKRNRPPRRTAENSQERRHGSMSRVIMQGSCTSFLNVKRDLTSGVTSVEYCLEHFGHEKEPQKLRLPWPVKLEIAAMLKQDMPVAEVARILQIQYNDTRKRQHWVTTQDVKNVAANLKANPQMYERRRSTSPEPLFKTELDPLGASIVVEFFKEEPCSTLNSSDYRFIGKKLGPIRSTAPGADSVGSSMLDAFIKEEPVSTASSTGRKLSPIEAKRVCSDGVRMFSLAAMPDGKGFALVEQSSRKNAREDVS